MGASTTTKYAVGAGAVALTAAATSGWWWPWLKSCFGFGDSVYYKCSVGCDEVFATEDLLMVHESMSGGCDGSAGLPLPSFCKLCGKSVVPGHAKVCRGLPQKQTPPKQKAAKQKPKSNSTMIIWIIVAVILAAAIGVSVYFFMGSP